MEETIKIWTDKVEDWEYLLDSIRKNKCVLFLGPDLASTSSGRSLYEELVFSLQPKLKQKIVYHNKDQFFFFKNPSTKNTFYNKFQRFHEKMKPGQILTQIAEIPFHLILSTSPDTLILKAFEGLNYGFHYYEKVKSDADSDSDIKKKEKTDNDTDQVSTDIPNNKEEISTPTSSRPIIYNLFGNIHTSESLVLANDDIFDFAIYLLANQNIPTIVKKQIKSANMLLFLGFGLQKWYIKLLLKLFELNKNKSSTKYAIGKKLEQPPENLSSEIEILVQQLQNSQSFCENHFDIHFLEGDEAEFIHCLHHSFPPSERRHKRSAHGSETGTPLDQLKSKLTKLLAGDELKEAIETLISYFKESGEEENKNDAFLLKSRLKRAEREYMIKETLKEEEYNVKLNRIRKSILLFKDDFK